MKTYYVRFTLDYETELDADDDFTAEFMAERMLESVVRNGEIEIEVAEMEE